MSTAPSVRAPEADRRTPRPASERFRVAVRAAPFLAATALGLLILSPVWGGDYPPGVDTPTFLHLGWVIQAALQGNLPSPFEDPYWYGGYPYLRGYPPLSYGTVGVLAQVTPLDLRAAYLLVLTAAVIAQGLAVFWLAREMGLNRLWAIVALALSMTMYPVMAAADLWGYFSTLVALPFAVGAVAGLERALRLRSYRWAVVAGVLAALCLLAHHMTFAALGMALVPWAVVQLVRGGRPRAMVVKQLALFGATALVLTAWWLIPNATLLSQVGFRREVPGLWDFSMLIFRLWVFHRSGIGEYTYPSYLGAAQVLLMVPAALYFLVQWRRLSGIATLAFTFVWFSLGADANPLLRHFPFSGFDVARFPILLAPFAGVLGAALLNALQAQVAARWPDSRRPVVGGIAAALVAAAVLAVPLADALAMRARARPYVVTGEVSLALKWLSAQQPEAGARVMGVGFWNWDTFLVPKETGLPHASGWQDETARSAPTVRRVRQMLWSGDISAEEAHRLFRELGTRYLVIAPYHPAEKPAQMLSAARARADLFTPAYSAGGVHVFYVN